MSKYRKIHCLIWHDDKFPFLDDGAQLVFFHAYTSTFSNGLGLMVVSLEALAASKRWPIETYRERFGNLSEAGICYYDERFQTVYFPNFLRYNRPDNPNSLKGALKTWDELPDCPHKLQLYERLQELASEWGESYQDVLETLAKPMRNVPRTFPEGMRNNREQRTENREQKTENRKELVPSEFARDRREGESERKSAEGGSRNESPDDESDPPEGAWLEIPLKSGSHWITQDDTDELQRSFPAVNVRNELKKCAEWNHKNRSRRKTARGIGRHIVSWLNRADEKAPQSRQDNQGRYINPRNSLEEAHNARINLKRERGEAGRVVAGNDDHELRGIVHQ